VYRRWVHGRYLEERAAALPRLELGGSLLRQRDESQRGFYPPEFRDVLPVEFDVGAAEVHLSQPLFTWGQVGAAVRAAREGVAYAEDGVRRARNATARDVAVAFYDVLAARELKTIADETVRMKERHLAEARRRAELGTATDYDVLAAEVAAANARPEAIRAENRVRSTRERLRFLVAAEHEVDAVGTLAIEVGPYPGYEPTLREAVASRPELAELGHQRGIARELVTIARAADKPRLDLSAGLGRRWLGVSDAFTDGGTWTVAVSLRFPFFDGRRTAGRVEQARSDLQQVELEEDRLRDGIALEVRTAVDAVREAGEILRALQGTVGQAERVLSMAERGHDLGVKTRLDVDDALVNLVAARAGMARAQRDYRVALAGVQAVMGRPPREAAALEGRDP
jgi:HAE1 family hydrophobic/amphiphilic exporter-1